LSPERQLFGRASARPCFSRELRERLVAPPARNGVPEGSGVDTDRMPVAVSPAEVVDAGDLAHSARPRSHLAPHADAIRRLRANPAHALNRLPFPTRPPVARNQNWSYSMIDMPLLPLNGHAAGHNSHSPTIKPALKVAFLGTYPPRKCGIATFTHDLRLAVAALGGEQTCPVVAMNDGAEAHVYPREVMFEIAEQDLASYERAAELLNRSDVDVVSVQHEFGIFGGSAGSHVLALLRALKMPVVTTLHTILRDPSAEQRRVMEALIEVSDRLVVMTERGAAFLREIYGAPADKIDLIAHGIHDVPFEEPERYKDLIAVEGRLVLLTFGLLSPNKGIEHVLNALPAIIAEFPQVVYLVLGATHPNLVREHGEAYRLGLERLAKKNGVEQHVIFYDRFVDLPELKDFIGAADVYLTPYLNEQQIVSGTLAYAFGAGKAVISTPYWHAAELLAHERGQLIPFADSSAIAREVCALLRDEPRRLALRQRAHQLGREMIWSRAAERYREGFASARTHHATSPRKSLLVRTLAQEPMRLPQFKPDHVLRLSDTTGMLQHAQYSIPNYSHGYCTDDNARALLLMLLWDRLGEGTAPLEKLTTSYAAFLAHALHPVTKRFRNFMGYDRRWLEEDGSEDSHGRALWALGACVEQSRDRGLRLLAGQLFSEALPVASSLTHPRTWAFALLGIHSYLHCWPDDRRASEVRAGLTERLMKRFAEHARDDWHWLADDATYDNARLPHALIASGREMHQPAVVETGLRALRWLLQVQTSAGGCFQPIGSNGFCHRNGHRARFDQQPIEVQATVAACLEAFRTTSRREWLERAHLAFEWFLGRNDLGLMLYDTKSGGCRDALHEDRVNENQGAESTLAFHLALAELKLVHNGLTDRRVPAPLPAVSP
jgi:glycosyltransferase involved in cell wall biosynthesis